MAENEELDLGGRHSGRWRRLHQVIGRGDATTEIPGTLIRCLYKTFQNIGDDVRLGDVCRGGTKDDGELNQQDWGTGKHRDYLEQFRLARELIEDPTDVAEIVVRNIADRFLDQIGIDLVKSGVFAGFADWEEERRGWFASIDGRIRRLAQSIAQHPDKSIRMPRRTAADRDREQRELQRMSLLPSGAVG